MVDSFCGILFGEIWKQFGEMGHVFLGGYGRIEGQLRGACNLISHFMFKLLTVKGGMKSHKGGGRNLPHSH